MRYKRRYKRATHSGQKADRGHLRGNSACVDFNANLINVRCLFDLICLYRDRRIQVQVCKILSPLEKEKSFISTVYGSHA